MVTREQGQGNRSADTVGRRMIKKKRKSFTTELDQMSERFFIQGLCYQDAEFLPDDQMVDERNEINYYFAASKDYDTGARILWEDT
jgi:hypothetical protein